MYHNAQPITVNANLYSKQEISVKWDESILPVKRLIGVSWVDAYYNVHCSQHLIWTMHFERHLFNLYRTTYMGVLTLWHLYDTVLLLYTSVQIYPHLKVIENGVGIKSWTFEWVWHCIDSLTWNTYQSYLQV